MAVTCQPYPSTKHFTLLRFRFTLLDRKKDQDDLRVFSNTHKFWSKKMPGNFEWYWHPQIYRSLPLAFTVVCVNRALPVSGSVAFVTVTQQRKEAGPVFLHHSASWANWFQNEPLHGMFSCKLREVKGEITKVAAGEQRSGRRDQVGRWLGVDAEGLGFMCTCSAAGLSPAFCLSDSHGAVGNLGNGQTQFTSQFGLTLAGRPKAVCLLMCSSACPSRQQRSKELKHAGAPSPIRHYLQNNSLLLLNILVSFRPKTCYAIQAYIEFANLWPLHQNSGIISTNSHAQKRNLFMNIH